MRGKDSKTSRAFWARGLIVLAAVLGLGLSARPAAAAPFAYVTINSGNPGTVSVINTASNTVVATVPVGGQPIGVAVTPDGKHAYVTNQSNDSVSVIDTASNTVVAAVPVGGLPSGVAITPDGQHAYVTNTSSGNVSVIATASNTVVATVTGIPHFSGGVAVTPDGKHAYVTNLGSATVVVIDTATNTVAATVPVGSGSWSVAIGPPPTCVPFSAFSAKLAIAFGSPPHQDAFGLLAHFTLASTSNGIDPNAEPVTLQVGNFAATIPPGSFAKSPLGTYTFIGTINGVNMEAVIQRTGGKQFALEAAALNANLSGTANPVTVRVSIGDDCGTTPVKALIF
ncbi:MAG: YncE family protein [Methylocella sp.]